MKSAIRLYQMNDKSSLAMANGERNQNAHCQQRKNGPKKAFCGFLVHQLCERNSSNIYYLLFILLSEKLTLYWCCGLCVKKGTQIVCVVFIAQKFWVVEREFVLVDLNT